MWLQLLCFHVMYCISLLTRGLLQKLLLYSNVREYMCTTDVEVFLTKSFFSQHFKERHHDYHMYNTLQSRQWTLQIYTLSDSENVADCKKYLIMPYLPLYNFVSNFTPYHCRFWCRKCLERKKICVFEIPTCRYCCRPPVFPQQNPQKLQIWTKNKENLL